MATSAHLAFENFIYRMEAITPSDSTTSRNTFRFADIERLDPDELPQSMRLFSVGWESSGPDDEPTCLYDRWAEHVFTIEVYYPVGAGGLSVRKLNKMMLRDRHDIAKAMRNPSLFCGYNSDHTTTDTGIANRVRVADALDKNNPAVWIYRAAYETKINEVE